MANTRMMDPKAALGQQRAELRQGARHKQFVGDDAASRAARAAELERVRQMREEREGAEARERSRAIKREPISAIVGELASDAFKLARTLVALPFRMAVALRGRSPSEA
jgi:hypothetical protein